MMRSLWTAASGMRAQQVNVDTIANNVANINTIGYKSQQASFKSLLYQNLQSTSTNNAGENKPVAAEVGLGSRVAAITSTFTQGNLTHVENPFSVALEGDGFFQIRTESGELQYTRDVHLTEIRFWMHMEMRSYCHPTVWQQIWSSIRMARWHSRMVQGTQQ